jgi:hypothetical protein
MQEELYESLNKSWKSTSRILFGEEIGELKDFKEYLSEPLVGKSVESCFSGKKIWMGSDKYAPDARFFDFKTENAEYAKALAKPLEINQIKDIDSLIDGIQEKIVYAGNKSFGNSKNVKESDSIVDSSNILNSSRLIGSKNIAYSYMMQFNEHCFGSTSSGQSMHIVRCFYNNSLSRCFEVCGIVSASESYFSYNIWNCNDCLFSFNLRSKKNMIANIQLGKEQYTELKKKLVEELADELKRKKKLDFSILDIVNEVRI